MLTLLFTKRNRRFRIAKGPLEAGEQAHGTVSTGTRPCREKRALNFS